VELFIGAYLGNQLYKQLRLVERTTPSPIGICNPRHNSFLLSASSRYAKRVESF